MDIAVSRFAGLLPETSETAALVLASACAADPLLRGAQALRTTLSVCLHAQVPMLMVWGSEARCIYNDACIALLGERHPAAFAQPLAELTNTPAFDSMQTDAPALDLATWSCSPVLQAGERLGALYVAGTVAATARDVRRNAELPQMFAALDQSPAFMAVLRGPDYIIESVSQRFHELVGERPLLGRPLLDAMPEIVNHGYLELLDKVRRSGQPFIGKSMTAYLQRTPGSAPGETFVDVLYQPMPDSDGRGDAIVVHGFDVTEQRRGEIRDSFLLTLEDALQHVSDPRQIIDTSVRLLGEHLRANRCAFGLAGADGRTMHVVSDHVQDMPSLQGNFPLEVAQGLRDALLDNRPWFTTDAMAPGAPDYVVEQYRRSGLRASLVIPLHKHGRLVAAIGVHQRAPRPWLSTEIELVRLVAARCWESMQRAKAQQQLAANEARLRGLADTLPQIIFIAGPDGQPHYFNQRWYEYTGLDPANNDAAAWQQAHTADGLRLSAQAWTLALSGERAYEVECELHRHDGHSRWHLARALPVRGDNGSISEWIGTYTDIHDRRAFEQQLRESEVRFRALCETVPAMIWMADAQGDCVYWNPRWYNFTGQGEDQALDQGWWDVMHPDDAARVRHAFEQALEQRGEFLAEYRVRRHDGRYRWCIDTASPHFASDGRFLGHIGSLTDISERKHIEDATASDRAILSLITTGAALPVVLDAIALSVEARGEIALYCSVMVLDEVSHTLSFGSAPHFPIDYRGQFQEVPIGADGPPCARSAFIGCQVICQDIQADSNFSRHHAILAAMGIVACCVTPILASNGQVLGTLNIYYDCPHLPSLRERAMARSASHLAGIVIERTRVDAKLKLSLHAETAARGQAEHASRVKDEFLATLSHELRTPLNAILGWSRLMQSEVFEPANLARGLVIIERSARAQTQIIDDLLDMSAILSGKIRLQAEHFDIAGLARSTVELMQPTALASEISLELDALGEGELWFFGDAGRLQQVLTNLLSNALKFTAAGGTVRVTLDIEDERLRFCVQDTGIGIAPDFLPHVFDRFRQADAGTTRRVGGLGLGLSISRQLVDLHGGSLGASSAGEGRGSIFTVVLPFQHGVSDLPPASADTTQVDRLPADCDGRLDGVRLLLVDDDQDSREAVMHFLMLAGAQVQAASSVDAAEQYLAAAPFDVLLSDIAMPLRDGYDLIRAVRSGRADLPRHIPAIALTAYVREEDRDRAVVAGFDAHMGKPVEPPGLVDLIERLILPTRARRDEA
ncbi:two-component system sensor protein [Xanthomonas fragariae]|uniref:histidine kinase n=4 Tax=Xanthomonas fragariae TaxID=48664 RepID=A0A1Y6HJN7_9XANT|nr:PAS domain S-box protein [Xanthomonas fragariae]AOD15268.1 histidine kinase [Xanthomonas fragariae]AOD18672.1 histidine kinase [Xanthomonas fragariae]ENZ97073.1 two-component system sensor protein [Xanthomonas fragariae LMG 25863]MBL9196326.1 PAS domain S-box protein [Xanthomonas fragariae]MBL9221780.1 PAS domain S-box protein [Xanthomonas fragariae]